VVTNDDDELFFHSECDELFWSIFNRRWLSVWLRRGNRISWNHRIVWVAFSGIITFSGVSLIAMRRHRIQFHVILQQRTVAPHVKHSL
jgi:hypothetical protein